MLQHMPSFVRRVENVVSFLDTQPGMPKALLITAKKETPPLWKGLSADVYGRMILGEGREDNSALMKHFKVHQMPVLMAFPATEAGTIDPIIYEGDMKYEAILPFLNRFALRPSEWTSSSTSRKTPRNTEDTAMEHIQNQEELETRCLKRPSGLCGILLVAPDKDSAVLQTMNRIARAFKSRNIQFVWMDKNLQGLQQFKELKEATSPSLILVHPRKQTYTHYRGEFIDSALIQEIDTIIMGGGQRHSYMSFSGIPLVF
jgi:hypothetical protein